jgi:hypothetical protein
MPRIILALAILGLALTVPAFAGSKVNIIYPSQARAVEPAAPESQPVKAIQQNVAVTIVVRPHVSNREIVKRALFQNWTGFINEYSGPRYPF